MIYFYGVIVSELFFSNKYRCEISSINQSSKKN